MKAKIEVRSLTGAEYSRAGARWSTQWTEIDDRTFTPKQLEQIHADPHLDVRVNGKRIRGGDSATSDDAPSDDTIVDRLRAAVAELREQNNELKTKLDSTAKDLAEVKGEKEGLLAKLDAANAEKKSLAAKLAELTSAKTSADAPQVPPAPAVEPARGSKSKA